MSDSKFAHADRRVRLVLLGVLVCLGGYVAFAGLAGQRYSAAALTANQTVKATGAATVGNGWAVDDGTTWGVSTLFAIDEATGHLQLGTGLPGAPGVILVEDVGTARAADYYGVNVTSRGTFDTSLAARDDHAVVGTAFATKSNVGGQHLTNVGLYGGAANGDENYAIETEAGDVILNQAASSSTSIGSSLFASPLTVWGAITGKTTADFSGAVTTGVLSSTGNAAAVLDVISAKNIALGGSTEMLMTAVTAGGVEVSSFWQEDLVGDMVLRNWNGNGVTYVDVGAGGALFRNSSAVPTLGISDAGLVHVFADEAVSGFMLPGRVVSSIGAPTATCDGGTAHPVPTGGEWKAHVAPAIDSTTCALTFGHTLASCTCSLKLDHVQLATGIGRTCSFAGAVLTVTAAPSWSLGDFDVDCSVTN